MARKYVSPQSLRNLPQYRGLPDEEFNDIYEARNEISAVEAQFHNQVEDKMKEYEASYDLSEMLPNDVDTLRSLIVAQILLGQNEKKIRDILRDGITDSNVVLYEKLNRICNDFRDQISKFQDTLKISRKIRKDDKEESVITFIENLKIKANKFYEAKSLTILCPKCNQLLAQVWLQDWTSKQNRVFLYCPKCGDQSNYNIKDLYTKGKGSNKPEVLPESIR